MNNLVSSLPPDPRTLPGRRGEIYYVGSEPDLWFTNLTIVLLYISGIVVIGLSMLAGGFMAATPMFVLAILGTSDRLTGSLSILGGALLGAGVGLMLALPIFACAQILRLNIHIEENTRKAKELTYLLLMSQKK